MYKRRQVFVAACIGLFLFGITFLTLGSILPLLAARFEAKGFNNGLIVSVLPIGVMIGSVILALLWTGMGTNFCLLSVFLFLRSHYRELLLLKV